MLNYEHVPDDAGLSNRSSVEAQASRLLSLIEARCSYMQRESRRAIEAYLLSEQVVGDIWVDSAARSPFGRPTIRRGCSASK
jgi:hypothetical protein